MLCKIKLLFSFHHKYLLSLVSGIATVLQE